MDIIEGKEERGVKKVALDILEVAEETVGLAASPSLFWLIVLWNSSGGKGFDGYVTNTPQPTPQAGAR
jgi:hypothetical protein